MPQVVLRFWNSDEAWRFWVAYMGVMQALMWEWWQQQRCNCGVPILLMPLAVLLSS